MVVVSVQPICQHFAYLLQAVEDIAIEYLGALGLVESLDIGVLRGFALLNVIECNALALCPLEQSVLAMNSETLSKRMDSGAPRTSINSLVERLYDPRSRQAGIGFDARILTVELVNDIDGAEFASRPQCVRHEAATPALIELTSGRKRMLGACWQPASSKAVQTCSSQCTRHSTVLPQGLL